MIVTQAVSSCLKRLYSAAEKHGLSSEKLILIGASLSSLSMVGSCCLTLSTLKLMTSKLLVSVAPSLASPGFLMQCLFNLNNIFMLALGAVVLLSNMIARNEILPLAGGLTTFKSIQIALSRIILSALLLITSLPAVIGTTSLNLQFIFFLSAIFALFGVLTNCLALVEKLENTEINTSEMMRQVKDDLLKIAKNTFKFIPQLLNALKSFIQRKMQKRRENFDPFVTALRSMGGRIKKRFTSTYNLQSSDLPSSSAAEVLGLFFLGQNPSSDLGENVPEALVKILD